jgi:hypothetical protein
MINDNISIFIVLISTVVFGVLGLYNFSERYDIYPCEVVNITLNDGSKIRGIEKALGADVDILESLTAIKRNYDSIEGWSFLSEWNTKVFLPYTEFLFLLGENATLANETTIWFLKEVDEPIEMRIILETDECFENLKKNY